MSLEEKVKLELSKDEIYEILNWAGHYDSEWCLSEDERALLKKLKESLQ